MRPVLFTTPSGITAGSSRGAARHGQEQPPRMPAEYVQIAIWLGQGADIDAHGRRFRVESRHGVAVRAQGDGQPLRTDPSGAAHHVGLLVAPGCLESLGGAHAGAFLQALQRRDGLDVFPAHAEALRSALELDAALHSPHASALLREAKVLELLARLIEHGERTPPQRLNRLQQKRLCDARALLLSDLAHAPSLHALSQACGLNVSTLKQGFRQLFGLPAHALHQRERMRQAWQLIASGQMSVSDAGYALGYANLSHFSAAFRKAHGLLPSEIKRSGQAARSAAPGSRPTCQ